MAVSASRRAPSSWQRAYDSQRPYEYQASHPKVASPNQNFESVFARRATIERARGILMAVHGLSEQQAFDLLRSHSQRTGRKLIDLAEAVADRDQLLSRHDPADRERP